MPAISFKYDYVKDQWEGADNQLSEIIRNVIRILALKFGGLTLTSLVRHRLHNLQVGGKDNSLHVPENCPDNLARAADFVLHDINMDLQIEQYCKDHFENVDLVLHDVGSGLHFHIEADPKKGKFVHLK